MNDSNHFADDSNNPFGSVIFSYTRANAIEDGVLVDISEAAKRSGFTIPVAMTDSVWIDCVQWHEKDSQRKGIQQDQEARLRDVLWMCYLAIRSYRSADSGSSILFRLHRVSRDGSALAPTLVTLKCVIGPGDQGEPVLTIMQPHED